MSERKTVEIGVAIVSKIDEKVGIDKDHMDIVIHGPDSDQSLCLRLSPLIAMTLLNTVHASLDAIMNIDPGHRQSLDAINELPISALDGIDVAVLEGGEQARILLRAKNRISQQFSVSIRDLRSLNGSIRQAISGAEKEQRRYSKTKENQALRLNFVWFIMTTTAPPCSISIHRQAVANLSGSGFAPPGRFRF